jgi:hypothetical protein
LNISKHIYLLDTSLFLFFVSERYFRNSDVRNFNFLLVHGHLAAVSTEAKFVISFWQTFFRSMPLSLVQRAKRALVTVLLKLAFDYGVAVDINRESDDRAVLQCYRRVVKKVHPDKGGHKKTFQTLQVAKEAWDTARQGARPAGNPARSEGQLVLVSAQSKQYRVQAQAKNIRGIRW